MVVLVVVDAIVVVVDVKVVLNVGFEANFSLLCIPMDKEISSQSVAGDLLKTKAFETIETASNINKLDTK